MQPLSFLSLLRFHPADFARFCIKTKGGGEKKKSAQVEKILSEPCRRAGAYLDPWKTWLTHSVMWIHILVVPIVCHKQLNTCGLPTDERVAELCLKIAHVSEAGPS